MAETTNTLQAAGFRADGTAGDRVSLPAATFDGTVNVPVMHQAVKAYLANQRQGTASTKIRKYVVGGNQKPAVRIGIVEHADILRGAGARSLVIVPSDRRTDYLEIWDVRFPIYGHIP